jgi:hypothetical protein
MAPIRQLLENMKETITLYFKSQVSIYFFDFFSRVSPIFYCFSVFSEIPIIFPIIESNIIHIKNRNNDDNMTFIGE